MKRTVQLLAFLVTTSIVFTSAIHKGLEIYFVYPPSLAFSEPEPEQCTIELQDHVQSPNGTEYWTLVSTMTNQPVKKSDLSAGETIVQHITRIGRFLFKCLRIRYVVE
jgi:hypothetical protein